MGGKQRIVFKRRCLQLPSRRQLAWRGSTIVLSCSKAADRKTEKRKSPGGHIPSGKRNQEPCRHYLKGNRHVIVGFLPHVKKIKSESGCKFGEKCVASQNTEEKWWKRICCFIEECEADGLRILRSLAENPSRVYGRAHNSLDRSAACTSQKVLYAASILNLMNVAQSSKI